MASRFVKQIFVFNSMCIGTGVLEFYGYYYILKDWIASNFASTQLKETPDLSEPVLIVHQDSKFIFAHKGGKTAVEAVINDAFNNNKLMRRAIILQILTSISLSVGFAKSRTHVGMATFLGLCTNLSYCYPIAVSAFGLLLLSRLVKEGSREVWENLNEARYVQRLEELYDPVLNYTRIFGMFGSLAVITYCTPLLGVLVFGIGASLNLHKKLQ